MAALPWMRCMFLVVTWARVGNDRVTERHNEDYGGHSGDWHFLVRRRRAARVLADADELGTCSFCSISCKQKSTKRLRRCARSR